MERVLEPEQMSAEARITRMRELLEAMVDNELSNVEELGEFIDLYNAHEVPEEETKAFYASLDLPEHNIIFSDSTFDTIVEEYDALGGIPRDQVPRDTSAIPGELERSIGKAYVALVAASNFFQFQEHEPTEPEILSRRRDFFEFAEEAGYPSRLASKAWNALARRFIIRVQPERFKDQHWYRREDYANFPANLFASYPALDKDIREKDYTGDKITDLRLSVLDDLLARAEPERINEVLGPHTGPKTFQFLKEFAASKRYASEEV